MVGGENNLAASTLLLKGCCRSHSECRSSSTRYIRAALFDLHRHLYKGLLYVMSCLGTGLHERNRQTISEFLKLTKSNASRFDGSKKHFHRLKEFPAKNMIKRFIFCTNYYMEAPTSFKRYVAMLVLP